MFARLQTRAHKFKQGMTLLGVIFENIFQNITRTEEIHFKNLKIDDSEDIVRASEPQQLGKI